MIHPAQAGFAALVSAIFEDQPAAKPQVDFHLFRATLDFGETARHGELGNGRKLG